MRKTGRVHVHELHELLVITLSLGVVLVTAQGDSLKMFELKKSHPIQAREPVPVEIQFITPKVQTYAGDASLEYHASLCGGCYYEGLLALFALFFSNKIDDDFFSFVICMLIYMQNIAAFLRPSNNGWLFS